MTSTIRGYLPALSVLFATIGSFAVAPGAARAEPPFLRLSLAEEPTSLDWNQTRSAVDRFILSFLMRGMMKTAPSGKPVCDLCESFTISDEGKTYTFLLRKDVKWSDGAKLEAAQFADSFRRLLDPKTDSPGATDFSQLDLAGLQAPEPGKLVVRLKEPRAHFLELMTLPTAYPIRKKLAEKANQDQGRHMAQSAVLGPYFLAAWEKGKRLVIEGNPAYPVKRPVYRVEFLIGTQARMVRLFQAGKLDVLAAPTTDVLMRNRGLRVQVNPYWATRNLVMNHRKGELAELGLRRSILLAIDRSAVSSVARNGERPATGVIPPGLRGHRSSAAVKNDASKAQAERHRAVAWPKWVELKLLVPDTETHRKLAEWIKGQLEKIHVRITVQATPSKAYYDRLENGQFDLAIHTWNFRTSSPLDLLETFQSDHPRNFAGWSNVVYDRLYREVLRERGDSAQFEKKLSRLIEVLEVDGIGVVPLGYPSHPFLLRKRVTSFAITPFGDPDLVRIHITTGASASIATPKTDSN